MTRYLSTHFFSQVYSIWKNFQFSVNRIILAGQILLNLAFISMFSLQK